jgi:hypothetical protein
LGSSEQSAIIATSLLKGPISPLRSEYKEDAVRLFKLLLRSAYCAIIDALCSSEATDRGMPVANGSRMQKC